MNKYESYINRLPQGFAIGLIVFCLIGGLDTGNTVKAQYLYFSMEVEPETSASTLEQLDFGSLQLRSGDVSIGLGESGMGIFVFRGLRSQQWMIKMEVPENLKHNQETGNTIPFNLNFAYNNRGRDNPSGAIEADDLQAQFSLLGKDYSPDQPLSSYFNSEWARVYVFVYGSINIDDVPSGVYSNEVTLRIEY